jgi:hypothetical protein
MQIRDCDVVEFMQSQSSEMMIPSISKKISFQRKRSFAASIFGEDTNDGESLPLATRPRISPSATAAAAPLPRTVSTASVVKGPQRFLFTRMVNANAEKNAVSEPDSHLFIESRHVFARFVTFTSFC